MAVGARRGVAKANIPAAGIKKMIIDVGRDTLIASRIASNLLDEPVVEVTPVLGKGSVNKVFIAEALNNRVVVRMSERGEAPDEYAKEAWCIEQAAARGVPVPSVLGVGVCEGNAYIVQSYIDGDEGRDSPAPKSRVWRELGRYARLIHSIKVSGFGLQLSEITGGGAGSQILPDALSCFDSRLTALICPSVSTCASFTAPTSVIPWRRPEERSTWGPRDNARLCVAYEFLKAAAGLG